MSIGQARVISDLSGRRYVNTADVKQLCKRNLQVLLEVCSDTGYFQDAARPRQPARCVPVDALPVMLRRFGTPAEEASTTWMEYATCPLTGIGWRRAELHRPTPRPGLVKLPAEVATPAEPTPAPSVTTLVFQHLTPEGIRKAGLASVGVVEAPPIIVNGGTGEVELNGHKIRVHAFRGQMLMVVTDLDAPLGYQPGGVADLIRGEWKGELTTPEHYMVLRGDDLREFKAAAHAAGATPVGYKATHLTVLTEAGADRCLLLSRKAAGAKARGFVADEVFQPLRRGEAVHPQGAPAMPPAADPRVDRLIEAMQAQGRAIEAQGARLDRVLGTVEVLVKRLDAPASPAAAPSFEEPTRLVPRTWGSVIMVTALLRERHRKPLAEKLVREALDKLKVYDRPDVAVCTKVPRTSHGVRYDVPFWRFAPSVVDEVDAILFPPEGEAQGTLPGTH